MSYRLNKTNGELVVELADGQIDSTSTDVTLVGRNYRGFGELFNENFIRIVENFASTAPPDSPLAGQLWYDTQKQRLKVYNGDRFRTAGAPIVSSTQPSLVEGDLWIDNRNKKLYFYDGNSNGDITLVGPEYDDSQGKTGFETESVVDTGSQIRVVAKFFVGGVLVAVITKEAFRLSGSRKIEGYPDDPNDLIRPPRQLFEKGFNLASEDFFYRGTAAAAEALADSAGNIVSVENLLPRNVDATTTGSISIINPSGLSVGAGGTLYTQYKAIGSTSVIETQQGGTDFAIRTRIGNAYQTPFFIDSSEAAIGIYRQNPSYTLDVGGDLHATGNAVIDGDLTVSGTATYTNVENLVVTNKTLELALLDTGSPGDDTDADGAGIIVKSSQGDKEFLWNATADSWTSNVGLELGATHEFRIDGTSVLSKTELGSSIKTANGLTSIGTLNQLKVDNLILDGSTLSSSDSFNLNVTGTISFGNSRIGNVGDPAIDTDVATKRYADNQVDEAGIVMSLDITGLSDPTPAEPSNSVAAILESLSPAANKRAGVRADIHCVSYDSATVTGLDIDSAADVSYVTVTSSTGTESVVQDIAYNPVSGTVTLTPVRTNLRFEVASGQWQFLTSY